MIVNRPPNFHFKEFCYVIYNLEKYDCRLIEIMLKSEIFLDFKIFECLPNKFKINQNLILESN